MVANLFFEEIVKRELFDEPPYSHNIALIDYHLFTNSTKLLESQSGFEGSVNTQATQFYDKGIKNITSTLM